MATNQTGTYEVTAFWNLIVALLPIFIIIGIFSLILRLFFGWSGLHWDAASNGNGSDINDDTAVDDLPYGHAICHYCGGEVSSVNLDRCPHCYAPAHKAFGEVGR